MLRQKDIRYNILHTMRLGLPPPRLAARQRNSFIIGTLRRSGGVKNRSGQGTCFLRMSRPVMNLFTMPFAGRSSVLIQALGYGLAASLIVLSLGGCASKQPPPPKTVKDFLKQPRPE